MKKFIAILLILLLLLASCTKINNEENSSDKNVELSTVISELSEEITDDTSLVFNDSSDIVSNNESDILSDDISESETILTQEEADRIMKEIIEKYNHQLLIRTRKLEYDKSDIHKVLNYSFEGVDHYFTYYRVTDPEFQSIQDMKNFISSFICSRDSYYEFKAYFEEDVPEGYQYIEVDGKLYMLEYNQYYCSFNDSGDHDWVYEGSEAKIVNEKIIMNMKMKNPGAYTMGAEYELMEIIYEDENWVINGPFCEPAS